MSNCKKILLYAFWFNCLVGGIASLSAQIPFTCEGQFLLTLSENTSSLQQITINPVNNAVNFEIINDDIGVRINAIGYRSTDNLVYGIEPNNFNLYQVDAVGGVVELDILPLNPSYTYLAGAITPDGQFLVLIGASASLFTSDDVEIIKVDLTDPDYNTTLTEISGVSSRIFDMAFDPLDNTLYGFDSKNDRLVNININSGVISSTYPSVNNVASAGSMFFDAFGNLFIYGSPTNLQSQNTLYAANKITGTFTSLTMGEGATGSDACSCPYTVEITKTVLPEQAFPCEEVTYFFQIANTSGNTQSGIEFEDFLPDGFTITEILQNPYGGTLTGGVGTNFLQISNMTVPIGIDSIAIRVNVGENPPGVYKNQAMLTDLPISLGEFRISDNPRTLTQQDSTALLLEGIPFDSLYVDEFVCIGEVLTLDVSQYGNSYEWQDGSTASTLEVEGNGEYEVKITAGCDSAIVFFTVTEAELDLVVSPEEVDIILGDSVLLTSFLFNSSNEAFFLWEDPLGSYLSCPTCPETYARPFFDTEYTLTASNEAGCTDSATVVFRIDRSRRIFVPNVFSPNGDGANDLFYIAGQGYGLIRTFRIFDRWGELVFESKDGFINDPSTGWDGSLKGKWMDSAVFTWLADIEFLDGEIELYEGDVTLVK